MNKCKQKRDWKTLLNYSFYFENYFRLQTKIFKAIPSIYKSREHTYIYIFFFSSRDRISFTERNGNVLKSCFENVKTFFHEGLFTIFFFFC